MEAAGVSKVEGVFSFGMVRTELAALSHRWVVSAKGWVGIVKRVANVRPIAENAGPGS